MVGKFEKKNVLKYYENQPEMFKSSAFKRIAINFYVINF